MTLQFECPVCHAMHSASERLAGRRVRCPNCDELVEVPGRDGLTSVPNDPPDKAQKTVKLTPPEQLRGDKTVVLQPMEQWSDVDVVEVSEVVVDEPPRHRSSTESAPPEDELPPMVQVLDDDEDDTEFRRPSGDREREETEMDMTPMVDVTFLLLIFFMVTAAFALQKSIEVPKPADDQPSENVVQQDPQDNPDFVTVRVDEFNTYHVITVDWEEEAPSVQDLYIRLRRARDGDSTGTIPTKLLVEAHGDAYHGRVVSALDAGTATGFEEVQLTTVEEE